MNEELKTLLISAAIGVVFFAVLMWVFSKINIGKKESREEIEERNFKKE